MFGNYDLVLPPIGTTQDCEFHLFTDDATLQVDGWQSHHVGLSKFKSPKHANLHFRSCIFDELPGFDQSLYLDANVRILGPLDELFEKFTQSGAGIGVYRHPLRNNVADEIEHCLFSGKVSPCPELDAQIAYQKDAGFADDVGLIETTIILKNHHDTALVAAMHMWQSGFQEFGTRDQFGLPFVLWKAGTKTWYQDHNFREPNPYFGLYPHLAAANVNPRYVYVAGRAYDQPLYKALLEAWHLRWRVKRVLRRLTGRGVT